MRRGNALFLVLAMIALLGLGGAWLTSGGTTWQSLSDADAAKLVGGGTVDGTIVIITHAPCTWADVVYCNPGPYKGCDGTVEGFGADADGDYCVYDENTNPAVCGIKECGTVYVPDYCSCVGS
jgi:hypothetical protein